MTYTLRFGKKFDREYKKLDKSISEQLNKKLSNLKEDPKRIGKPLLYTKPTIWEIKVEMFRIFYGIDQNKGEVYLLSVKHKDECNKYIRGDYTRDFKEFLDDVSS